MDSLVWFAEALGQCVPDGLSFFAVSWHEPSVNGQLAVDRGISFPILSDTEGSVRSFYGLDPDGTTVIFVLGPNPRVLDAHRLSDRESSKQRILAALESVQQPEPVEVVMQAPVLLVSELLERDFCERLIGVWQTQGNVETGVEQTDPLICSRCQGKMRIISFLDRPDVIKKILGHLGLWEQAHAPQDSDPARREITLDLSYSQLM